MGAVLAALGFGGDEGGGDAAVKRQAEGLSNPMYQLANLMGQVSYHRNRTQNTTLWPLHYCRKTQVSVSNELNN